MGKRQEQLCQPHSQSVSKGYTPLESTVSPTGMRWENKSLLNILKSVTLSSPNLWCWLVYITENSYLNRSMPKKPDSWIQHVSLWPETSQQNMVKSYTISLHKATSYTQTQLSTRPSIPTYPWCQKCKQIDCLVQMGVGRQMSKIWQVNPVTKLSWIIQNYLLFLF